MEKLVITRMGEKICTALVSDGNIVQLTLEDEGEQSQLGNIYIGKVSKVVKGINAAFIDIAPGVTGYYSLEENKGQAVKCGDELPVQVSRDAVKTKAPVLTSNLSFAGRYCVVTAGKRGMGFSAKLTDAGMKNEIREYWKEKENAQEREPLGVIVRTNGAGVSPEQIYAEYERLADFYEKLKETWRMRTCYSCVYRALPSYLAGIRDAGAGRLERIITDDREIYEALRAYILEFQKEDTELLTYYEDSLLPLDRLYSLETALKRALDKRVWLKSGGYLVIEPTEAMVVIDVNTGKYSGKKNLAETIRKINWEAAEEIGRQLRLRNLSGIIMVDFIDMEAGEDREALMAYLERVVSRDPVKTVVVEMTRLNLVELTRKKVRRPLYEQAGAERETFQKGEKI